MSEEEKNESMEKWLEQERQRKKNAQVVQMLTIMNSAYDEMIVREMSTEELLGASELFIEFFKKLVKVEIKEDK